jgi:hypothetical protein
MHDLERESKTIFFVYLTTVASMGDDHRWMYDGWKKNGAHTDEWWKKTGDFIECAFSLVTTVKIRCPCVKCQNSRCFDKVILTKHLVKNGFTADYETWVFHGEKYATVATESLRMTRRVPIGCTRCLKLYNKSLTWILRIHLRRRSRSSLGS